LSDTNKWNETIDSVQEKNFVSQKKNKLRLTELGFDYLVEHVSIRDVLAPILDNPKAQLLIRVVDSIESFLAEEEEQDEDPSSSYSPTPKPRFYYPDPSEN
jgi:hypothetical protein